VGCCGQTVAGRLTITQKEIDEGLGLQVEYEGGRTVQVTGPVTGKNYTFSGLERIYGAGARDVRLVCIVAAPEGLAVLESTYPGVSIYTPVIDTGLNARKFILPGLGDFGDRLYGTT